MDRDAIRTYFAKLGLEREIADLYLALHTDGPQTISALSRSAQVERTRIYRLIDKLLASNLIEVEMHYKRGVIKAAPIANLHILINQKEQELRALQDELGLVERVLARNSLSSPATRVQFYRGPEGIRQMLWNELQATDTLLGYHYQILDSGVGNAFMHRWAAEVESRGLQRRVMFGEAYVASWRARKPAGQRIKGIAYHYLPADVLPITHSCDVYDDVVAYYNWQDGEVFGIEIHNKQIAAAQRRLLEGLWAQSRPETRF
ncbi:MAG TPA: helix-turn-helix domain-containing protein [Candidatus Saccharimonadales bacterium]|nr:helix-turn-helix domain-containing protein [Candidatus Saccharimonadales bacterium]